MAFQPVHFQAPPQNFANESVFENAARQYEALNAPQMINQKMAQSEAKTFMDQLEAKHKQDEILANLKLKHAQALHYEQRGAGKGERQFAPSDLGKLFSERKAIVSEFGKDSPEAKMYDNAMKNFRSQKEPALSNLGKILAEQKNIEAQFGKDSPEAKAYGLAVQKATTDSKLRQSAVVAGDLEKTMNSFKPTDITRYSGIKGGADLLTEKTRAQLGKPSKEYLAYEEALVGAQTEAKEIRMFFGDSITPEASKHIYMLTNPSSLGVSPEVAAKKLEKSRSIIKKQIASRRKALQSTDAYIGEEEASVEQAIPQQEYSPIPQSMVRKKPSQQEIINTAKNRGISPEQVIQMLRSKGIEVE